MSEKEKAARKVLDELEIGVGNEGLVKELGRYIDLGDILYARPVKAQGKNNE